MPMINAVADSSVRVTTKTNENRCFHQWQSNKSHRKEMLIKHSTHFSLKKKKTYVTRTH